MYSVGTVEHKKVINFLTSNFGSTGVSEALNSTKLSSSTISGAFVNTSKSLAVQLLSLNRDGTVYAECHTVNNSDVPINMYLATCISSKRIPGRFECTTRRYSTRMTLKPFVLPGADIAKRILNQKWRQQ